MRPGALRTAELWLRKPKTHCVTALSPVPTLLASTVDVSYAYASSLTRNMSKYAYLSLDVVEAARVRLDWSQPNQPLYGCALCRVPFLESATLTSCEIARTLDIRMDRIQQLTIEVLKCSLLGSMTQTNVCITGLS